LARSNTARFKLRLFGPVLICTPLERACGQRLTKHSTYSTCIRAPTRMYNMRLCSDCQHSNPDENRHCSQCGNSLQNSTSSGLVLQPSNPADSFGWPASEPTRMTSPISGGLQESSQDLARCPQCASSQTQSFEMAYSVSTSTGVTAGGAYTFGVGPTRGAARTFQQSNLASYVRPPIQPTTNNGCLIGLAGFIGASIAAAIANSVLLGIRPMLPLPEPQSCGLEPWLGSWWLA
jgi:hypothetical protein